MHLELAAEVAATARRRRGCAAHDAGSTRAAPPRRWTCSAISVAALARGPRARCAPRLRAMRRDARSSPLSRSSRWRSGSARTPPSSHRQRRAAAPARLSAPRAADVSDHAVAGVRVSAVPGLGAASTRSSSSSTARSPTSARSAPARPISWQAIARSASARPSSTRTC